MPTTYPYNGSRTDLIDIFLHHSTQPISNIETLNELNSDYNPVLLTVEVNLTAEIRRNFSTRAIKWNVLQDYLREISLPSGSCSSIAEVDATISSIAETIKAAKKDRCQSSVALSRLGTPDKGKEKGEKEMATPEASRR